MAQFPQPVSADEKLKDFDSVPLFMRSLPEETDDVAINALQSLVHEGTPDEIAENFKDQGNDYFKGKRFKEARDFYTQGIDANPIEPRLVEALLCNRAACNLELKNYGSVLRDCSRAILLNRHSSKGHYRSALALISLERYDEAIDCCTRCLEFDSANSGVQQLLARAQKGQEAKSVKERQQQERLEREAVKKRALTAAFKLRNIIPVHDPQSESSPYEPYLEETEPQTLVVPVFFLYPEHAISDLVSRYYEDTQINSHLEEMFPSSAGDRAHPPPEWDVEGKYLVSNLVVYMITYKKRLLKIGKRMTLRDVCNAAKGKGDQVDGLELKNGCLTVVVLPKGDVEQRWVEEFKATQNNADR